MKHDARVIDSLEPVSLQEAGNAPLFLQTLQEGLQQEIENVIRDFNEPPLSGIPSGYRDVILSFVARRGKRIRPLLFLLSYYGYTNRAAENLFRTAVSLELLHEFILIHDDIIDHAEVRRNDAAMHVLFQKELKKYPHVHFRGEDLAMVVGDMLYALALRQLLEIDEDPARKHRALRQLTDAALYTVCGELSELAEGLLPLSCVTEQEMNRICQWKTAHYTFCLPLTMGATLAGAPEGEVERLFHCGLTMGLAFQIRDDVLDLLDGDNGMGKPTLNDIRERKATLPIWMAWQASTPDTRQKLERLMKKADRTPEEVEQIHALILSSGALGKARCKVEQLKKDGLKAVGCFAMAPACKQALAEFCCTLLDLPLSAGEDSK